MAVLRGAAGWIIRQAAAMQAAAGGRRWRACPPRWRRWRLRCCCCEVWQGWQAVGAVQAGQGWRWCVVIGAALVPVLVCCWQAVQVGGVICCGGGALAWSSSGPRGHRAGPLLIRQAGQAAGGAKEKGQGGGAWCAAALAFCLYWRCDLLRRVRPGAYRGRRWSAPRSGAGLPVLALIRAQRFQLATFQRVTGAAAGAPSGAFLPFAGGVRFSTLPGSALGVGLELSEL